LSAAAEVGASPIRAGTPQFAAAVQEGTIKWVVTESGELVVSPASVQGREISHAFLSGGAPVRAAGQAEIAAGGGRYFGLNITSHSGHFLNGATAEASAASEQAGRDAFARIGVTFPQ